MTIDVGVLNQFETVFSAVLNTGLGVVSPIPVAFVRPAPAPNTAPPNQAEADIGMALTVYQLNNTGSFRISATNLGAKPVQGPITLRWWIIQP